MIGRIAKVIFGPDEGLYGVITDYSCVSNYVEMQLTQMCKAQTGRSVVRVCANDIKVID